MPPAKRGPPGRLQSPTQPLLMAGGGEAILGLLNSEPGRDTRRGQGKGQLGDGEGAPRRPPVSPAGQCWSTGRYRTPRQGNSAATPSFPGRGGGW